MEYWVETYLQIGLSNCEQLEMLEMVCPSQDSHLRDGLSEAQRIKEGNNIYTKPIFNIVNMDTKIT